MSSVAVNVSHVNPSYHTYAIKTIAGRQRAFLLTQNNCIRMKKFLFLSAFATLLIGCKGQNEPAQVQAVQFTI